MTFLLQIQIIIIVFSLAMGQIFRYELTPQIAFYLHDIFIVSFIISSLIQRMYIFFKIQKNNLFDYLNFCFKNFMATYSFYFYIFLILLFFVLGQNIFLIRTPIAFLYQLRFLTYLLFFACLRMNFPLFSRHQSTSILASFFLMMMFLGLGQYLMIPDTSTLEYLGWDDHRYRLIGTWFDPAFTGITYVFAIIFFIHLLQQNKIKKRRKLLYFCLIFALIVLLLTYSRSSYLSLLVVSLFYFSRQINWYQFNLRKFLKRQTKKFWYLLGAVLFIFIFVGHFFHHISFKHPSDLSDSTNLWRFTSIAIRGRATKYILSSFTTKTYLVGEGFFVPVRFPTNMVETMNFSSVTRENTLFPDNFFILLLDFFGLPITLLLVFLLFKLLQYFYDFYHANFYLLLALLVHAQFNQSFLQPFVFLLMGFLLLFFYQFFYKKNSKI